MAHQSPTESAPTAKQLVFLVMMATVVAVIVFLCGVLVGRGVPLQRGGVAAFDDAGPDGIDPPAFGGPEAPAAPGDEVASPLRNLSYFERLSGAAPQLPAETLDGPAPEDVGTGADPVAAAGKPDEGTIVIQVTALPEASAAASVAARLAASGYPAFVVAPEAGAPTGTYRVRVGPYADRQEVEAVRRRLETEERFETWIIQR